MTTFTITREQVFTATRATSHTQETLSQSVWTPSCRAVLAGRIASAIAVAFLIFDASLKLLQVPVALETSGQLGFDADTVLTIGMIQVLCLIVYLVPRTRVLGAILWTGYLGGAIVTHLRIGNPLFSHTLFPIYIAVLLWAQPWVSDARLRALVVTGPNAAPPEPSQSELRQ